MDAIKPCPFCGSNVYLDKEDGCIDELGGTHYNGIGVNPNGVCCGECGRLTCKDCRRAAVKEL